MSIEKAGGSQEFISVFYEDGWRRGAHFLCGVGGKKMWKCSKFFHAIVHF